MWTTITAWLAKKFGSSVIDWVSSKAGVFIPVIGAMLAFFLGGYLAHLHYASEIAELNEQAATVQAQLQKEKNEALTRVVEKQVELDTWRDTASKRISDLTHRVQLAEARSKRAAKSDTTSAPATGEARCRELLVEGANLVGRCSDLLGSVVVKHDTLVELNK